MQSSGQPTEALKRLEWADNTEELPEQMQKYKQKNNAQNKSQGMHCTYIVTK